jgi:hypothetical protein
MANPTQSRQTYRSFGESSLADAAAAALLDHGFFPSQAASSEMPAQTIGSTCHETCLPRVAESFPTCLPKVAI